MTVCDRPIACSVLLWWLVIDILLYVEMPCDRSIACSVLLNWLVLDMYPVPADAVAPLCGQTLSLPAIHCALP